MENQLFFPPQTNLSRSSFSNQLDLITDFNSHDLDEFALYPGFLDYDDDSLDSMAQAFFSQIDPESNLVIPMAGWVDGTSKVEAGGAPDIEDAPRSGSVEEGDDWEVQGDGGDTSGTRPRRDRARTLLTERKRRGRMKEKLYELRSLVPNITKMDKASIIADAAVYVRDLQGEAKKLEEEIAALESTTFIKEGKQIGLEPIETRESTVDPNVGRILKLTVHGVGEWRFYVRIECSSSTGLIDRVPGSLYRAIETLDCFHLESSNFSTDQEAERCVLSFILNQVSTNGEGMNVSAVKFRVTGALLNHGFQFERVTFPLIEHCQTSMWM